MTHDDISLFDRALINHNIGYAILHTPHHTHTQVSDDVVQDVFQQKETLAVEASMYAYRAYHITSHTGPHTNHHTEHTTRTNHRTEHITYTNHHMPLFVVGYANVLLW